MLNISLYVLGRVTDCGVRGLGFKSRARFLLLEQKQVRYHEWSGMVESPALYRYVAEKKSPTVELAVEQPQLFRKLD